MDTFGPGAASTGLGGGGIAMPRDAGAVFLNPGILTRSPFRNETLLGYQLVRTELTPFPSLWWDTNADGLLDESDAPLETQPDYVPGDGLLFATNHRLGRKVGVGAALFLPHDRILSLNTFDASLPHYPFYDSQLQFYAVVLAAAVEVAPGVALGAGARMIPWARYDIAATIDATVTQADPEDQDALDLITDVRVDVHEMNLLLVPSLAPFVGLHWDVGALVPALQGVQVAGTWRGDVGLPVQVTGDVRVNVTAEDLGELGDILIPVTAELGLDVYDHYLPEQRAVGVCLTVVPWLTGYVDLRQTLWSRMNVNVAQVVQVDVTTPLWTLDEGFWDDGNPYEVTWADTWSWRGGAEYVPPPVHMAGPMDHLQFRVRGGGGIEPSPLVSQTADTAFLDADRMVLAGGLSAEHMDPFKSATHVRWDLFYQDQILGSGQYTRPEPGVPTAGYPREGDPEGGSSIPVGGHIWTAGAQLQVLWGDMEGAVQP